MSGAALTTDGSSPADALERVTVDREQYPHRWTCPGAHGNALVVHRDWSPTNNHIICRSCQRLNEGGREAVDPEYYYVLDQQTGELVPWSAVDLVS